MTLIDHTTAASNPAHFGLEDFRRTGRGIAKIVGLDQLRGHSHAASCLRITRRSCGRARPGTDGTRPDQLEHGEYRGS